MYVTEVVSNPWTWVALVYVSGCMQSYFFMSFFVRKLGGNTTEGHAYRNFTVSLVWLFVCWLWAYRYLKEFLK